MTERKTSIGEINNDRSHHVDVSPKYKKTVILGYNLTYQKSEYCYITWYVI